MLQITYERTAQIIEKFKGKTIAVVGDVMLDRYFWGSVSRVSPEAPVPVVDLEKETFHLGGAANVAANLKSLGLEPLLCGMIGNDRSGKNFVDICNEIGINPSGLFVDINRQTTVKTRVIGNYQHIARLDRENRRPIAEDGEKFIINSLKSMKKIDGIIFEDYDKGAISPSLIREVLHFARQEDTPIYVDPKFSNFFHYRDVTLFKPNRKETEKALGYEIKNDTELMRAGSDLLNKLKAKNVLITLGAEGMMLFEQSGNCLSVPTRARKVSDVSGAGDTAIATLAAAHSGGATITEAANLANFASGIVCEEPGIVSVTIPALLESIKFYGQ